MAPGGLIVVALVACDGTSDNSTLATLHTRRAVTTTSGPSASTGAEPPGDPARLGLPTTVRNGTALRLVGACPFGSDYISLVLPCEAEGDSTGSGDDVGVGASTSTFSGQGGDGSVDALVAVNLDPGTYVVRPQCRVERTPPPRVFAPFNITVTGPRSRAMRLAKQWMVVVRGAESHPVSVSASECWRHDGRDVLVVQTSGGFSNVFDMPAADVASIKPVITGSSGCRDVP
jgi:hypothetical protein